MTSKPRRRRAARILLRLVLAGALCGATHSAAQAQVNIAPQALEHYANCIEQAQQLGFGFVTETQRGVNYRCRNEVAVSYFQDLARRGRMAAETTEDNVTGVYVLRPIWGIGFCWHKIRDEARLPVSYWGCDVFVAY